ncbi:MAG: SOS response-associated peptidase [Spirochaetales bacterium]|nr:SOS response-associated peptidase [Spirochaetales bacterium]
MCFNASLVTKAQIIEDLFQRDFPDAQFDLPQYYVSAFQHPSWPIIKQSLTQTIDLLAWGLIPHWVGTPEKAYEMRKYTINARWETLDTKPSFKKLVQKKRCVMLMDGYVEWQHSGQKKIPYRISLNDHTPFALGGLWDENHRLKQETFTVVTQPAEGIVREIHNTKQRMPLFLSPEMISDWLNPMVDFFDLNWGAHPMVSRLKATPIDSTLFQKGQNPNSAQVLGL